MSESSASTAINGNTNLQPLRVDTQHLPGSEAFALWQDEFVPYWEVRPVRPPEEKFASSAEIHQFGAMALGTVKTPAQWIDRSRYRIARDGFTQFGIQIVRQGHIGKRDTGSDALASEPGDVLISDLSQCSTLEASNLSALFFSVPRDALEPLLTSPDHHNQRVISGKDPLAALLRSHLFALHEQAGSMDPTAVQSVMKPTLELTAAALNAQVTDAEADAVAFALTLEIRRHVERRITDRLLSPEDVAGHFGISLRKLYYLFEPFGGFAAFVREKRLHRVREALCNPSNRARSIAEIAEEAGFGNYAAFVRAFRKAFEISPRELRILTGKRPWGLDMASSNAWNEWLVQTR
jgi:AraC-like DNA-binding protein